jgi:8-oxo-dGTP diphosphatase
MQDCSLGIVFDQSKQRVLLLQRRDIPVWVLPGGGIDRGETSEQAVVREVEEETGFRVNVTRKAAEYTPINRFTSTTHVFECCILNGQITSSCEGRDIAFFSLNALPDHFFQYHREWLHAALAQPISTKQEPMSRSTFRHVILFYFRHPLWGLRYLWTRLTCAWQRRTF